MKVRVVILGLLIGVLLFLLWVSMRPLSTATDSQRPDAPGQARSEAKSAIQRPSHEPIHSAKANGATNRSIPSASRKPDAIANEFVLRFATAADLDRFLRSARERRVTILGTLAKLNAVRIRVDSREKLKELLHDGPEPIDYDNNYWVRVPEGGGEVKLPEGAYMAFGNHALQWLGVQEPGSDWGKGVTVAILDTGVGDHPTLQSANITRLDLLGGEATLTGPYQGHATAVASIVAGLSAEAQGVAPASQILSIRVASGEGAGNSFTLAWGIVEAVDRGAGVINISMGSQGDSFILRDAIAYATEHGVTIVASTGNDALDSVSYPARYPEVVAVSAVDGTGRQVYFSNRGPEVDLAAPGVGVYTAWTDGQIVGFSGTSASSPFVAGAIAMLMSQEPGLTSAQATEILLNTSNDSGAPSRDDELGAGMLNIDRALTREQGGIYDIAIAAHYWDSAAHLLWVTAQNRGTENLPRVDLTVQIDGAPRTYSFSNVKVGQTVAQSFPIDPAKLQRESGVAIGSVVSIAGMGDSRPGNNDRSSILRKTQ